MKNKPQPKAKVVVEKLPSLGLRVYCLNADVYEEILVEAREYGATEVYAGTFSFYLGVSPIYDTNEVAEYLATVLET